jgi:hypothetical protein
MKMRNKYLGSVAPLALLFTLVSMTFTAAYLKNSFSQTAMEKYRYSEWKALYAAEAGLHKVGVVVLPKISGDTLLLPDGVEYGKDENDEYFGQYKDIDCKTELQENSTRKRYVAQATGVAEYTTPNGNDVSIERTVFTTMVPRGFEEFMYFTNEEVPIGPGNTGTVNFGSNDVLEGKVHSNGQMVMSIYGCPEFTGDVNITHEAIEEFGSGITGGDCENSFLDEEGNSIIDTVSTIIFPPDNSAEVARANATHTFSADDMLWRVGKKDTMIMTEINFVEGGFWVAQWWYNIPPVGSPAVEYDFIWDSLSAGLNCEISGVHFGPDNEYDYFDSTYYENILVLSATDASGNFVQSEIISMVNTGDVIRVQNTIGSRIATFTATNAIPLGPDRIMITYDNASFYYSSLNGNGFNDNEPITFINTSATTGLAGDVEWNSFYYYHDHLDNGAAYCEAGRIQHFDFEYWNYGGISGTNCDIFSCPSIIYNSDYAYGSRLFYPKGSTPKVIYIRGGQVLVRGIVDGQYSIVTDDYTEYRRHDDTDKIDRVWGNIWLIDDVVYSDSYASGQTIHPNDGGSTNVLGLIAGGNVIIANTRPNGARGKQYGEDIIINASILAMNGGFISHYWQNTLLGYHDFNDGLEYGIIADGRGGHRNYYQEQIGIGPDYSGVYTGTNDFRGDVNLWGSIVQFKRGYMLRNYLGPYNVTPGVGYDKNYNYDYNLLVNPPPYFPDLETENSNVVLKMASYGEAKK